MNEFVLHTFSSHAVFFQCRISEEFSMKKKKIISMIIALS